MKKNDDNEVVYVKDYYGGHKILIWVLIAVIVVLLVLTFINRNKGNNTNGNVDTVIVIKPDEDVSVGIGNSTYLSALVDGYDNKVIKWQSSDESIATVNSNGVVTGKGYGKVTIIATYTNSDGKSFDVTKVVTVADGNSNVTLTDVKFPEGDLYMPTNSSYQLSMVLVPSNALISDKTFTSSDTSVATVDEKGIIRSIGSGHSRIIATINEKYKRSIEVYVNNGYRRAEIVVSPSSLSFDNDTRQIKVGTKETLNYTISPSNSDRSKLTWTSSDTSVVTVTDTGVVTGKKVGKAIVSVSSINGKKDDIIIEVYNDIIPVTDIIVSATSIKMEAGKTQVITPIISPENASNQGLNYTSLNSSVVSVVPTSDGRSAILSALKAGSTTIVISSNNVEKRIVVTVEGNGNNSYIDEDTPDLPTTIQVRSNKNNLAKTYEGVKEIAVSGVTTVSISLSIGVGKIKYCINRYGAYNCTPDIDMAANDTVEIPSGGIYVLRVKKYDYAGNEIGSNSINYVDGVLNYYINTTAKEVKPKEYTVTNAYSTESYARSLSKSLYDKVTVKLNDATRQLKMCATTGTSCTPYTIGSSYSITLNKTGLWKLYVEEYDENKEKIGNTEVYYSYVKSSSTPTPKPTITPTPTIKPSPTATPISSGQTNNNNSNTNTNTNINNDKITVSNLKVNSAVLIGKYLAVDVESTNYIQEVRFCYRTENQGSTNFCAVDTKISNPPLHNGHSYFHPYQENTTFYAVYGSTKKKTFWFDIDGLDYLYDNNITNKDVLFAFAVGKSNGSNIIYSNPVKVRIRMTRRSGNDSYWTSTFVK